MSPRLIRALFHGQCTRCDKEIQPGDLIGFALDGRVVCVDCRVEIAPQYLEVDDERPAG